jgi:hypothetical protein
MVDFGSECVKMDVEEYVCCSKGHESNAICCVTATMFCFTCQSGKKAKMQHVNSVKRPQASSCIRWLNVE